MEIDPLVRQFAEDARAYCEFIESFRHGTPNDCFARLLRLLSALAKSGEAIPFDMPDDELDRSEDRSHEQHLAIVGLIREVVTGPCGELEAYYEEDEEIRHRTLMICDDLADIYRDLIEGLDAYDRQTENCVAEAVWQWRFGYEHHWGIHLFNALKTVHGLRHTLLKD
jgi:hypothetical protein